LKKKVPIEQSITLKIGAMVVLVVNLNTEYGFVNGLQGVVVGFEPETDLPIVNFVNGEEGVTIGPYTWSHSMGDKGYTKGGKRRKTTKEFIGVKLKQIPLRLAFAISIHKSQSMTLEYVEADLTEKNFAPGQVYTAISRATSLKGLSLTGFSRKAIIFNPIVKKFYRKYTSMCDENIKPTFLPIKCNDEEIFDVNDEKLDQ
jgi:hypothetical protein